MRTLLFITAIFVSLLSCKDQKASDIKTITVEQETNTVENKDIATDYATVEFTIEGMSCAVGCAGAIEKNLATMEGVKMAKVNFEEKLAIVEYDDARLNTQDIVDKVTTTGDGTTYKVLDLKKAK